MGLRTPGGSIRPGDRIAVVARPFGSDADVISARVGTVARVEAVRPGAAGGLYLDAVGEALVIVEAEADPGMVWVGAVDPPHAAVPAGLLQSVQRAVQGYMAARVESGEPGDIRITISDDPVAASHEVASLLRISWPEVQELLEAGPVGDRLGRALLVLRRETGLLRSVLGGKGAT
jgi:hypothetical protein